MSGEMPPKISIDDLADLLRNEPEGLQVIDCRDEDFVDYGGHIRGCLNVTQDVFRKDEAVDALVVKLAGMKRVTERQKARRAEPCGQVFHCMLSQIRGPFCASRFAEALARSELPQEKLPEVFVLRGGWRAWKAKYGDTTLSEPDA